jgi:signal transduction histidine kinase
LIREGKSIRVPDIASDSRSVGFPPDHPPMHSLLGVPIKFKREVLGDLYLTDKMTPSDEVAVFSDQDQMLLEMFASQAAIAIKNAQHYRQSQQLTLLQERERFGMDLHDGVIQSIYAVGLMLESVQAQSAEKKTISTAIDGLNDVIRDIRNYILHLRPQYLQGRHLPEGLEELARELRAHSFLSVDTQTAPGDWTQIAPERTIEILHIAREALTNVRKHAQASRVDVTLARNSQNLLLTITDNGRGFDPAHVVDGNGLRNMRERTQALGGTLEVSRVENGGMRLALSVPFA